MFYIFWASILALGAVLAVLDWRWIRRPACAVFLLACICGGFITTKVSPFNFADGGYYLQGALVFAASALALISYFVTAAAQLATRYFTKRRRN
jgi:hypothetical protein